MKKTFLSTICLAWAMSYSLDITYGETVLAQEIRLIARQHAELEKSGLRNFLAIAQSNHWNAPKIHSQCWVDWLPEDQQEKRLLEQAKRDFGLELAKAIDQESLLVLEPGNSVEREEQATFLLDFSVWAGSPGGYGNYAIKRRVEHLACIPIGHLVADLNYPLEKIDAFIDRFETDKNWLRMQVNILNEESPHKYNAKTKERLAFQWHQNFRKAAFAFKKAKGRYPYNHAESLDLPREVSFYCEDETLPRPYTLTTRWNTKRHYVFCVMGYESNIEARVKNFLLFRKVIGRFPERPSRPLQMFDGEEIREGFYEAWKPHEKKFGKKGSGAAQSFIEIQNNRFMDYDTAEFVSSLPAKSKPEKQKEVDANPR